MDSSPACDRCGSKHTQGTGGVPATADEQAGGASRIEGYRCTACSAKVRCAPVAAWGVLPKCHVQPLAVVVQKGAALATCSNRSQCSRLVSGMSSDDVGEPNCSLLMRKCDAGRVRSLEPQVPALQRPRATTGHAARPLRRVGQLLLPVPPRSGIRRQVSCVEVQPPLPPHPRWHL